MTARAYTAAGGLPPQRRLEDLAFSHALRRIDARIRYSPIVRATTSARITARVDGGFGTFIGELYACARRGASVMVEHPQRTLEDLESRAAIRRIREGNDRPDDIARASAIFNLAPDQWLPLVDRSATFGAVYQRLALLAERKRRTYPDAPVEFAIDTLRTAIMNARHAIAMSDDAVNDAATEHVS